MLELSKSHYSIFTYQSWSMDHMYAYLPIYTTINIIHTFLHFLIKSMHEFKSAFLKLP